MLAVAAHLRAGRRREERPQTRWIVGEVAGGGVESALVSDDGMNHSEGSPRRARVSLWDTRGDGASGLPIPVVGHGEGIFKVGEFLRAEQHRRGLAVVGERDALSGLPGEADQ